MGVSDYSHSPVMTFYKGWKCLYIKNINSNICSQQDSSISLYLNKPFEYRSSGPDLYNRESGKTFFSNKRVRFQILSKTLNFCYEERLLKLLLYHSPWYCTA